MTNKRNKQQFFVLAISLWQGDKWQAVAGPFSKRAAAQQAADELADNGFNDYGQQNLSHVVRTIAVSKTAMIRKFKIAYSDALAYLDYIAEQRQYEEAVQRAEAESDS